MQSSDAPLRVLGHPMLNYHLAQLRDQSTSHSQFREALEAITMHLALAVCEDLEVHSETIETPLEKMEIELPNPELLAVSILRAGNGLVEPFLKMIPFARAGHIGIERSADGNSNHEYYFKVPKDCSHYPVVVLDPMLATGGSASACIERLKQEGFSTIKFASVVACPEGVKRLQDDHPDVKIVTAVMDRELNEKNYILPGLGDAGDRLYGTI